MKRVIATIVALTVCIFILFAAGCVDQSEALSPAYDKAQVEQCGRQIASLINDREYESVVNMLSPSLRDQLTAEELEPEWGAAMDDSGAFREINNVSVVGQKDAITGADCALVVLTCKFEKMSRVYSFLFNTNMELVGIYLE